MIFVNIIVIIHLYIFKFMLVEIKGEIHQIIPPAADASYPEMQLVLTTGEHNGRKFYISTTVKGDLIDRISDAFKEGDKVHMRVSLYSTFWESGNKWFTKLTVNTIEHSAKVPTPF